ncbi:MAG: alpha/beta fold hydrolase [Leptospira sp.]|nr:alpha/beta fold hydrolase [Leptospira sp.]
MTPFKPIPILSGALAQSILASWKSKADKNYKFLKEVKWHLLKTSKQISLLAALNEVQNAIGILILLHGWEGSIESSYIIRTTRHYLERGYSVYRLNLRDHGGTHHLNEGIFNGSLLEETYEAVLALSKLNTKGLPLYLAGFSLGGNFVVRITSMHTKSKKADKIKYLKHSFSISPALDPMAATIKMDSHIILRDYFLKAWITSLRKKEQLFPHLYKFPDLQKYKTVMQLTETMILDYSPFLSVKEYFQTYTLKGDYFKKIKTPLTILTAADDPVIPVSDFREIPVTPYVEVIIEEKGGHCGFIEDKNRTAFFWRVMSNKMP